MNEIAALLRDFGQGASNAAASNVSGPVDLLAWALRKGGVPVPSNPILGSEWMRQKGLLADPRNKIAGLLGEAAGLSAPIAAAAKAPQIARGLLAADDAMTAGANKMADHFQQTGANFRGPPDQRGAIVWHGSPHKFDAFDASKIGTGEGAQAYGHGLYLAESPDVAKSYQSALTADRGFSFGGKTGLTRAEVQDMVNAKYGAGYLDGVIRPSGVADSFIDDMVTGTGRAPGAYPRNYKPGSQRAKVYDELRGQIVHADPGSLYKVDLPDEKIARMLDWDKPLSQLHPDVIAAVQKIRPDVVEQAADGASLYQLLGKRLGGNDKATVALRQAGIPGIRYLDGGSRGAGAGTSNYVVFPGEEAALNILERNGNPINALVQALKGPR